MDVNPLNIYEPLVRSKEEAESLKSLPFPQGSPTSVPVYSSWASWDSALNSRFEGSNVDYASKVGDLSKSSLIMSAVRWLGNTLPEAPLQVKDPGTGKGDVEVVDSHELLELLRKPNDYYAGDSLWTAFAYSWIIDGNVYFIKVWNKARTKVVELWYEPHWTIRPRWWNDHNINSGPLDLREGDDKNAFILYYELDRGTQKYRVEVEDVVHFRDGNDPYNPRKGWSYIRSIYREIYSDNELSNLGAQLGSGSFVPPFFVGVDAANIEYDEDAADRLSDKLARKTKGDKRGNPMVVFGGKAYRVSYSPQEMDLKMLHRFSEERFGAVTGIPLVVLGLGAGLDHSIYNNVKQADERAYEAYLIPLLRRIASQVSLQVLPDFEEDRSKRYATHDLSKVRALQEDEDAKSKRIIGEFNGGFITFNEARVARGYEKVEGGDFVLLPANSAKTNTDDMANNGAGKANGDSEVIA